MQFFILLQVSFHPLCAQIKLVGFVHLPPKHQQFSLEDIFIATVEPKWSTYYLPAGEYHPNERWKLKTWNIEAAPFLLFVTVPPEQLSILGEQGLHIKNYILGPYNEGDSVNITCVASGGRFYWDLTFSKKADFVWRFLLKVDHHQEWLGGKKMHFSTIRLNVSMKRKWEMCLCWIECRGVICIRFLLVRHRTTT